MSVIATDSQRQRLSDRVQFTCKYLPIRKKLLDLSLAPRVKPKGLVKSDPPSKHELNGQTKGILNHYLATKERQHVLGRTIRLSDHRGAGLDEGVPAGKLGRLLGHIDIHDLAHGRLVVGFGR